MARARVQTTEPRSVQQKEPASALASVPYLVPLLAPAMVRYLDLETARARAQTRAQTRAPRLVQQMGPA